MAKIKFWEYSKHQKYSELQALSRSFLTPLKPSIRLLGRHTVSCTLCILRLEATVLLDQERKRLWEHTWPFQLEWQSWAGLMEVTFPCALPTLHGRALSGSCAGRREWWRRDTSGEREGRGWELLGACLHLQNKGRGWQKDYSGYFLTVEGCMCDVALHCYIRRPVCSDALKIIVFPLHFFVFLLFCSLASPHSCFLYYFIPVSGSLSLPPPLSHSSSFFSFPPSLSTSLPLPPTSHLCMCHFQL